MALFFWDNQGVVMVNYLEQSHSINNAYYADELRQLCQVIARKIEARITESWCFALVGQRLCPHVTSCHDCYD